MPVNSIYYIEANENFRKSGSVGAKEAVKNKVNLHEQILKNIIFILQNFLKMMKQALLGEFEHEAENTRKLLSAIPDTALEYRTQPHLWSVGQLASHIAEVYNWYDPTFNQDTFDMSTYTYDKGDISTAANILQKFEENVAKARAAIENSDEAQYMNTWTMHAGGDPFMPPMPKIQVIRGFLYNHLYHHRGEMISHLRATGNKVPGLYGPNFEESQQNG